MLEFFHKQCAKLVCIRLSIIIFFSKSGLSKLWLGMKQSIVFFINLKSSCFCSSSMLSSSSFRASLEKPSNKIITIKSLDENEKCQDLKKISTYKLLSLVPKGFLSFLSKKPSTFHQLDSRFILNKRERVKKCLSDFYAIYIELPFLCVFVINTNIYLSIAYKYISSRYKIMYIYLHIKWFEVKFVLNSFFPKNIKISSKVN